MAAAAGFFKKDRGVTHLGAVASAGAAQASAAAIPFPTTQFSRSQDVLVEITGVAFANLPAGTGMAVGDLIIAYTKAGATPTLNSAVADTLVGGAVVYAANTSHSFRLIELAAGVATWILEK